MSAAVITASASVIVAVLAFILNQQGQVRQERRQARLARVNTQLRELYGPLNALIGVNEQLWNRLRETSLPSKLERSPAGATEDWVNWRDAALMPANRKMRDLIVEHADLLVESTFPQVLSDFCAHVASLDVLLSADREKARSLHPLVEHPGSLFAEYVQNAFVGLKAEQQALIRITLRHEGRV